MIKISNSAMAALVIAAVFTTGIAVGGMSMWLLQRDQRIAGFPPDFPRGPAPGAFPPSPPRGFGLVDRLSEDLDLDDAQRDSVTAILDRQQRSTAETLRRLREPLRAGIDSTNAQIRRLLSPEQAERFDTLTRRERNMVGRMFRAPPSARELR